MSTQVASLTARFTADTTSFDSGARRVQDSLNQTDRSMRSKIAGIGTSMTQLGMQMAIPAAAINAVMGVGIKAAIDFESAFAGVIKTVDGSDAELSALRDTIREMATDASNPLAGLDNAHETIAGIMELGGQLGVPLESLDDFAQTIGSLTIATDLTAESASLMLAQFAAVTGMDFDNMDELGSTIVALGNNMATTESNIVGFMQRLGGIGNTVGLTEPEIAALSAAMASVGLNAEAGGTAMTTIFNEMISAVATGGTELENFARVSGVSAEDFADTWNANPVDALTTLLSGFGELDEAAQVRALEDLGLDGIRTADVMRRLSGDVELVTGAFDLANEAWDENTALSKEAGQRLATTEAQFNVFKNTIKDLAISVGDALLPMFNKFLSVLQWVAKGFSNFLTDNPAIVRAFGRIGAVLGVVAGGLITFGTVLAHIGVLFNPITWAIAGFAVAIAGIGALWESNFGGIASSVGALYVAFRRSFRRIIRFVDDLIEAFSGGGLSAAVDAFKEGIGAVMHSLSNIWSDIDLGEMKDKFVDAIKQVLSDAGAAIGNIWDWFFGGSEMVSIGTGLATKIDTPGFKDDIVKGIKSALSGIGPLLGNIWDLIFGSTEMVSIGTGLAVEVNKSGAVGWVEDNLITPMVDAIGSVDFKAVGNAFYDALMLEMQMLVSAGAWVLDNIVTPIVKKVATEFASVDWTGVKDSIQVAVQNAFTDAGAAIGNIWDWFFGGSEMVSLGTGLATKIDTPGFKDDIAEGLKSAFSGVMSRIGDIGSLLFGDSETVIQGGTMFEVNSGGMVAWVRDSLIMPMVDAAGAAIESVNWENVGAGIVGAIGSAIGSAIDFVTWITETILQPTADNTEGAAEGTDWSAVPGAIFGAIADAILTLFDLNLWVADTIILPMIKGALQKIYTADWSEIASSIFGMMALAILLFIKIPEWVWSNIVEPIATGIGTKFGEVDWLAIGTGIMDGLASGLGDMGQWAYDNIVAPIVDQLGSIDNAIGDAVGVGSLTGDVNAPLVGNINPLSLLGGNAEGTPWTGSMGIGEVAGLVHGQEAVVPHDGMRVIPSPRGLMLEGSMGGGGGRSIVIHQLDVHGVENAEDLFDQLQRVARARA